MAGVDFVTSAIRLLSDVFMLAKIACETIVGKISISLEQFKACGLELLDTGSIKKSAYS